MKRFLALLVAVGMVVGAYVVRQRIDEDDGGGTSVGAVDDEGPVELVCIPELATACRDGTVEDAATTIDRLVSGDDDIDVWLTLEPMPAMVDLLREQAGREPLFQESPERVAATVLGEVGAPECDWRCIGEGDARLGAPDPDSATGLLIAGAATVGFFGTDAVATNDFTPEFDRFLERFQRPTRVDDDPVRTRLLSRAFFDVALDLAAPAEQELAEANAATRGDLKVTYPDPVAIAFAVVAVASGSTDGGLAEPAGEALVAGPWVDPDELANDRSNLPSPGVLVALRERIR